MLGPPTCFDLGCRNSPTASSHLNFSILSWADCDDLRVCEHGALAQDPYLIRYSGDTLVVTLTESLVLPPG